jgi:hypothetical protein
MSSFHKVQDVYFDAIRLYEELDSIPSECNCLDAEAHLRGECCCAVNQTTLPESIGSSVGCHVQLVRLRHAISFFEKDLAEERSGISSADMSDGLGRAFFNAQDTVRYIGTILDHVEDDLKEFRRTCAQPALQRLKSKSGELRKCIARLNNPRYEQSLVTTAAVQRSAADKRTAPDQPQNDATVKRASPPTIDDLKAIAQKYRVCYEVWPEWAMVAEKTLKIGFDLQLCGSNDHQTNREHAIPGCSLCVATYGDLRRIAQWIMLVEDRPSRYEVEPFDRALHIAPGQRRRRNEVVLTIKILHRHEFDGPVDDCEERCLKEMKGKMGQLGVREGSWYSIGA